MNIRSIRACSAWVKQLLVAGIGCVPMSAFANHHASVSEVTANMLVPVDGAIWAMGKLCLVIGAGLIIGSAAQYRIHRRSPTTVRFSVPLSWLLLGIAIVLIGLFVHVGRWFGSF